ncbi:helix-turn-helix domain-containing protein [Rhodospirillum sp. A1_3_36]|uniref:helix-turn-helix domain-containing protein n=1 Tax=Rhodospirillum sp. A1_3_36 TaxID=3391666 RepID=UPI0039A4E4C1
MNPDKLCKLLALASSGNDAEALSALRMAKKMLKAEGLDFKDVASSISPSRPQATPTYGDYYSNEPPKPKGYSKGGFTWESREAYESYMANQAKMREAERQRYAPARAAVLEKYGSAEAAIARNDREQVLHEAVLPWLESPNEPTEEFVHLAGRWHQRMGGWAPHDFKSQPLAECRAAIKAALPMPTTIREAREEARSWEARDNEICHALECWGDEQLDLPAAYRRELVRRLWETELPIVTMDDLLVRLEYAADADDMKSASDAVPSILDAFRALVLQGNGAVQNGHYRPANSQGGSNAGSPVHSGHPLTATERRARILAMLSNLDTCGWSDRAIARAVGVSPTTVGVIRKEKEGFGKNSIDRSAL